MVGGKKMEGVWDGGLRRERAEEKDAEIDELRRRVRELEDEVHELRMQQRITSLATYEGTNPEQVMRRLLGNGSAS